MKTGQRAFNCYSDSTVETCWKPRLQPDCSSIYYLYYLFNTRVWQLDCWYLFSFNINLGSWLA